MSRRLRQVALCDKAAAAPESRAASPAAIALWQAAGKMQDAGMGNAIDAGLLMVVRDKIDAMLMEGTPA